jgi:hypothetical protein
MSKAFETYFFEAGHNCDIKMITKNTKSSARTAGLWSENLQCIRHSRSDKGSIENTSYIRPL